MIKCTFTVEDALFSPIGISILSGAGLLKSKSSGSSEHYNVHVHECFTTTADLGTYRDTAGGTTTNGYFIDISSRQSDAGYICTTAPIFITTADADNSIIGEVFAIEGFYKKSGNAEYDYIKVATASGSQTGDINGIITDTDAPTITAIRISSTGGGEAVTTQSAGENATGITNVNKFFVDYYRVMPGEDIDEIQITKDKFAGYFYVEAHTTYRRQTDGKDLPAIITFPNVKIQSNFTIEMSADGDPSSATFTMDAFPGYTYFDNKHEVLCTMQIINSTIADSDDYDSVFKHNEGEDFEAYSETENRTGYKAGVAGSTGAVTDRMGGYDDSFIVDPADNTGYTPDDIYTNS